MGIYVAEADDAPGAAVIGMLLMAVGVVLGVRAARNRLPMWAARAALAVGVVVAAFAAFLTHGVVVTAPLFPQSQEVPSVVTRRRRHNTRRPSSARGSSCAQPYWSKTCPGVRGGRCRRHRRLGRRVRMEGRRDAGARHAGHAIQHRHGGVRGHRRRRAARADQYRRDSAAEWSPEHIGEPEEDFPLFTIIRHVIFRPIGLAPAQPLPGDRATFYVPRSDDNPGRGRRLMYMRDLACCTNGMAFYSTPSDLVRFALATNPGGVNGELAGGMVMSLMTGATAASSSLSRRTWRTRTRPRWRCESGTRSRNRRDDRAGQRQVERDITRSRPSPDCSDSEHRGFWRVRAIHRSPSTTWSASEAST